MNKSEELLQKAKSLIGEAIENMGDVLEDEYEFEEFNETYQETLEEIFMELRKIKRKIL